MRPPDRPTSLRVRRQGPLACPRPAGPLSVTFIETMTAKYPDYGNLTTLEFSAGAAFAAA
jgi:hypothetical protein